MVKRPLQQDRVGGSSGTGSSAIAPAQVPAGGACQAGDGAERGSPALYLAKPEPGDRHPPTAVANGGKESAGTTPSWSGGEK